MMNQSQIAQAKQAFDAAKVVLLDIEGTIAPIQFVYDVMFPYAREHVRAFLDAHLDEPSVLADIERFRELAESDATEGVEGALAIADADAPRADLIDSLVAHVHWQMDSDRKTTALKSLQGKVWRDGFESSAMQSVLFADVPDAIRRWKDLGKAVAIYSSGSVQAQRLFMTYSRYGDLSDWVDGWFDTQIGPKKDADSYRAICELLRVQPDEVVFCTDVVAEADAAAQAGLVVFLLDRPGNRPQPDHDHPELRSFAGL